MKTLTPSAAYTALTNLCPQDGVDPRSIASLEPLFQAILNRVEYINSVKTAVSVKDYGAEGDGTTDDSDAIVDAMVAASANGGEVLFPPGTYRITETLTLPSLVSLVGQGATILVDNPTATTYAFKSEGSQAAEVLLTVDANAGDKTITIDSSTGITQGSFVTLYDTRASGRHPVEILEVEGTTATTLTFRTPILNDYDVAISAGIKKQTFSADIAIRGLTFQCSAGADILRIISLIGVRNVLVEGCRFIEHRASTAPTTQMSLEINRAHNVSLRGNYFQNGPAGTGNAIQVTAANHIDISGNQAADYSFGIGLWNCATGTIRGNTVRGIRASGNRGIKVAGCQGIIIDANIITAFDSGVKIEDSGRCIISGNQIADCGYDDTQGVGINISHQNPTAGENGFMLVTGNRIRNQKYIGVNLGGSTDTYTVVDGNVIENCSGRGIYGQTVPSGRIAGNTVYNWGTAYAGSNPENFAAVTFGEGMQVEYNVCIHPDGALAVPSFYSNGTFTVGDGSTFVGNVAPTKACHNTTDHDKISQNHGNAVSGYGQKRLRGTAAPVAGTFEVGDRVVNAAPAAGAPPEWVCVTAGTPGTWKELPPISY